MHSVDFYVRIKIAIIVEFDLLRNIQLAHHLNGGL